MRESLVLAYLKMAATKLYSATYLQCFSLAHLKDKYINLYICPRTPCNASIKSYQLKQIIHFKSLLCEYSSKNPSRCHCHRQHCCWGMKSTTFSASDRDPWKLDQIRPESYGSSRSVWERKKGLTHFKPLFRNHDHLTEDECERWKLRHDWTNRCQVSSIFTLLD